ncbi:MAG: tRNA uridine-5-carboxymethylaminomethyl(34) synthesis enzyme MnmG [Eubacteriales bacterium]|nr:tRNA uridine-5-carboxymethylaminomethyl(34) synthesis enzyme MnmG [Eubacteriales bacterium]
MKETELKTEIAVIGAGHAGIEAALASARMGIDTVLFTINLDSVGNMPCNPSIGGSGKGHLVFEIDALGGEMGRAADDVTLQSRTLNLGKGAAVHSKRVQADRIAYRARMKRVIEKTQNLRLVQSEIVKIFTQTDEKGKKYVTGILTNLGERWACKKIVICSGTYLNGEIFVGDKVFSGGPDGLMPARGLSESLINEGIRLMRFKTGTPARVARRSVDFSVLDVQDGEKDITPYSQDSSRERLNSIEQIPCHVVYTNAETHKIILDNLDRSAMYSGNIHGVGPRYCPSIETKLVRFKDKERHQLFIEPTGLNSDEMYIQGFSTSMPTDVQWRMLRSLKGFENAQIMRYAYAIEYDCIDPTQLLPTLEFKSIGGLYGAGQFNGTSGYEEAAAQGIVAGINAALSVKGEEPMVLTRSSSYIGTLIDDLVTKGTREPYRIMTSRSEYRLLLRQDNADRRLTDIGRRVGLISDERYEKFCKKRDMINAEIDRVNRVNISPSDEVNALLRANHSTEITSGIKLSELMKRPELDYDILSPIDTKRPNLPKEVRESAYIEIKYEGYIKRQLEDVRRLEKLEKKSLSPDTDYFAITGLRKEAAEKLDEVKPLNIGQASRISGVNPADISVLLIYFSQNK